MKKIFPFLFTFFTIALLACNSNTHPAKNIAEENWKDKTIRHFLDTTHNENILAAGKDSVVFIQDTAEKNDKKYISIIFLNRHTTYYGPLAALYLDSVNQKAYVYDIPKDTLQEIGKY